MVIDLAAWRKGSGKEDAHKLTYMVDMAKAEAMDHLGEQQAAVELAARHNVAL